MPEFYDIEPSLMGGMRAPSAAFYLPEEPEEEEEEEDEEEPEDDEDEEGPE